MKTLLHFICILCSISLFGQVNIADFTSIEPGAQTTNLIIPESHAFQKIIQTGDSLSDQN